MSQRFIRLTTKIFTQFLTAEVSIVNFWKAKDL